MATPDELKAYVAGQIPDNLIREVKPLNVRNSFNVVIDQIIPAVNDAVTAAQTAATLAQDAQDGAEGFAANASASVTAATAQVALAAAQVALADADVVLTHADVALTHADVALTNADVTTTGTNVTSSGTNATTATTQAGIATTQAGIATTQATAAAASATAAASVTLGALAEIGPQANGELTLFSNQNAWPDPTLLNTTLLASSGTGTVTYILNRGRRAIKVTSGNTRTLSALMTIDKLGLVAGGPASFGVFLDEKTTTTNTHFTLNIEEQDSGGSVLATTTVNGPTGNIITGSSPVYTSPQPVVYEGLVLNASTAKIRYYLTFGGSATSVVSRFLICYGTKADFKSDVKGRAHLTVASPNLFRSMDDYTKFNSGSSGVGVNNFATFNGQKCMFQSSNTNRQVNLDYNYVGDTGIGVVTGDTVSFGVWVESIQAASTLTFTISQFTAANALVQAEAVITIAQANAVFPMWVPLEGIVIAATADKLRINIQGGGTSTGSYMSRFTLVKGPKIAQKAPTSTIDLVFQKTIKVDTFNSVVRYPDVDMVVNGVSKYSITPISFDATTQEVALLLPSVTTTPSVHVFDTVAAIAGTNPFKAYANGALPLDMSGLIVIGYASGGTYSSKYPFETNDDALQYNEIQNANFAGGVLGSGVTLSGTIAITATSTTDLTALGIAYSLPMVAASGKYGTGIIVSIADQLQGAPFCCGMLVYSSDGTFVFTGAGTPAGPGYVIRQTNTATVANPSMTNWIPITANLRLYYAEGNFVTGLAAGQGLNTLNLTLNVPTAHANNFEVVGFMLSTKTKRIERIDWRNWANAAINARNIGSRVTAAEATIVTNTTNIATNTTAIAALGGASQTTTAKILVPKYLDMVAGRPITLYRESLIDQRNTSPASRRLGFHASDSSNKPYARNFDACLVIDPDKVGTSGRFVLQSLATADLDSQNYKDVTIRVSAATKSVTKNVMCIGDSVTAGLAQEKLRAKLAAAGVTIKMVGTQANGMTTPNRGEGRSGWRFYYWVGAANGGGTTGGLPIPALAVGGEAAYMATPDPNVNPFLRVATGGDAAGIIFNGYVFDPAFYQSRFNGVTAGYIPTPDIVTIAMGVNDVNSTGSAIANVNASLPVMVAQIKAAWPSCKIAIIPPIIGTTQLSSDNTRYQGANGIIAVRKRMLELYDTTTVANVEVMNHWPFIDTDFDFDATGSPSTDSQTGTVTATKSDYLHPVAWGTDNYSEATFAWIMNKI